MTKIPKGWTTKESKLVLTITCADFKHAVKLLNKIGAIAESHNHHPDMTIQNYNELTIATTTHDANTITAKDYELAQAITDLIESDKTTTTEQG
jgi:4a-hydroxytetrahydrobiopterin dehydratase